MTTTAHGAAPCPTCHGDGLVPDWQADDQGQPVVVDCVPCLGLGYVLVDLDPSTAEAVVSSAVVDLMPADGRFSVADPGREASPCPPCNKARTYAEVPIPEGCEYGPTGRPGEGLL